MGSLGRLVSIVLACIALALIPIRADPTAAAAPICTEITDPVTGVVAKVCYEDGRPPVEGGDPGPGEGAGTAAPRICSFGSDVVPCDTYAGNWTGTCYAKAAEPQPPLDDAVWAGRTDGVVVVCTPFPCLASTGTVIDDCPGLLRYWALTAPVVVIDEGAAARRALAQLDLDPVTIAMAPQPSLDEPNVLIGAPSYFWATGGAPAIGPLGNTVTQDGLTITLNATLDSVTYDTGDGTTLTCTREQVATAPSSMSLQGEPDCGHRWGSPGTYALTATSAWTIAWQGPTQNGTFDYALGSTIDVAVTDRPVNLTTEKTP